MALKFLNKKGWHTGSLRNIENVWKAEQKHEQEQKKLDELRRQIQEERDRAEFRRLQEQAGLVPRQERLEFLYDSGLAVGRSDGAGGSGVGFKALEPAASASASAPNQQRQDSSLPGALFEEKPLSTNDSWRKLHSDPLFLIRQREQEALARIKKNPVQMAQIRKSVEEKKHRKAPEKSKKHKKHRHKKHASSEYSDSENDTAEGKGKKSRREKSIRYGDPHHKSQADSEDELNNRELRKKSGKDRSTEYVDCHHKSRAYSKDELDVKEVSKKLRRDESTRYDDCRHKSRADSEDELDTREMSKKFGKDKSRSYDVRRRKSREESEDELNTREGPSSKNNYNDVKSRGKSPSGIWDPTTLKDSDKHKPDQFKQRSSLEDETKHDTTRRESRYLHDDRRESQYKRRTATVKLTDEEREAKLRQMQMDAELHEEQRWKRLRKAEEDDRREAAMTSGVGGRNFLDAAQKCVFGAERGGSATIEESVRRRTYYSQGRAEAEGHAFRRH